MILRYFFLFVFLTSLFCAGCNNDSGNSAPEKSDNYVVMLSLDGFRWDYPDSIATPNLDRIAKKGVKAKSLKPAFPTKTFPNHYSMATGLYPDHHGLVLNSFYDPETEKSYSMIDSASRNNPLFYAGEPIWETTEKNGLTAATFFWVGSDVRGAKNKATYWEPYNQKIPFSARIDSVINWLKLPEEKRPELIMWYMHEPDAIGHYAGPHAAPTDSVVMRLDSMLGIFLNKIDQLPFKDQINIIVTSDHGMGKISNDRVVDLSKYTDSTWFSRVEGHNPNYLFQVKQGYLDTAFKALSRVEHISVWKHGEVPEELNYGNNPRTLDLIVLADWAWSITYGKKEIKYAATHGFDNRNKDMHAIFYAFGPDFKENYTSENFENVDLYILISKLLNLKPAETDGNINRIKPMLKQDVRKNTN
ncbi:MAG: ectonucleotide pyrophosphatase/phosphodiesterase [Bacteroidales bacterium]|nr:ectonucleotide pyrophosphatase/phosphodiesterase [Bacteroidales bacterium]MCF8327351.1 ectonucleotide pyrophosphatase/phosphodiesterase [Bacteroidales bacterium]